MLKTKPDSITRVKKVAPYPIKMGIIKVEGQPPLNAEIVKLTEFGFLARITTDHFFTVGEIQKVFFELPVVGAKVETSVNIIKTYYSLEPTSQPQFKTVTIEMHFLSLSQKERFDIDRYLARSGQK